MDTGPRQAGGGLGVARSTSSGRAARASAIPWARFSAWLECVCVVTFDLELGQALEVSYGLVKPPELSPCLFFGDLNLSRRPSSPDVPPLPMPLPPRAPPFPRLHPRCFFPPSHFSTPRAHPPGSTSYGLLACSFPAWSRVLLDASLNTLYPQADLSPNSLV